MTKLYSDRYVGTQLRKKTVPHYKLTNNGKMVEILIVLGIGSAIVMLQCMMVFSLMNPLVEKYKEINQIKQEQTVVYDEILSELNQGGLLYGN